MNEQIRINIDYAKALHEREKQVFSQVQSASSPQEVTVIFDRIIENRKVQLQVANQTRAMLRGNK